MPIVRRIATTATAMSISTKVKPHILFNVISPEQRLAGRYPFSLQSLFLTGAILVAEPYAKLTRAIQLRGMRRASQNGPLYRGIHGNCSSTLVPKPPAPGPIATEAA